MAEENSSSMNLDLNLGPVDNSSESFPVGSMNLQEWLDSGRHINQRWMSFWRQIPFTPETRVVELGPPEVAKTCEEDDDKKNDTNEEGGSFFDCNICLDISKDPVVTCCGHLFCWTCLYRWLHHHSDAKECPVCKGEVTTKNVTPIYGRGNNNNNSMRDSNLKIPVRPQARRVESWRQAIQRSAFTIPMEQMIRRLGSTFDFGQDSEGPRIEPSTINNNISLLNRILTSRGMRREHVPLAEDVIDLTAEDNNNSNSNNNNNSRRISSLLLRRSSTQRAASLASGLVAVESYFDNEMDQGRVPNVDDRDSVSSIAAIIQSESQTVDTAVEINSTVSSSRRRVDVDSEDFRATRRRRLN